MQKILFICIIAIIIVFQYQLYYGHGGYLDDLRVKQQVAQQSAINRNLTARNASMSTKITSLRGSDDLLAARARQELNLIKQGETLIALPGSGLLNKKQP